MSFINPFNVTNNSNDSSTVFRNADAAGNLVSSLNIGATGIYNYVPYVPLSIPVKNNLSQIGGYIDISGSSTQSISTSANDRNFTSVTLPPGTYLLRGHMRVSNGAAEIDMSTNTGLNYFCFSTSSTGFINPPSAYASCPLEYKAGTFKAAITTGEFHKHCTSIVNLTSSTPIYLNWRINHPTTINCTVGYDMSVTRLA